MHREHLHTVGRHLHLAGGETVLDMFGGGEERQESRQRRRRAVRVAGHDIREGVQVLASGATHLGLPCPSLRLDPDADHAFHLGDEFGEGLAQPFP